jgi:hypothetical protein
MTQVVTPSCILRWSSASNQVPNLQAMCRPFLGVLNLPECLVFFVIWEVHLVFFYVWIASSHLQYFRKIIRYPSMSMVMLNYGSYFRWAAGFDSESLSSTRNQIEVYASRPNFKMKSSLPYACARTLTPCFASISIKATEQKGSCTDEMKDYSTSKKSQKKKFAKATYKSSSAMLYPHQYPRLLHFARSGISAVMFFNVTSVVLLIVIQLVGAAPLSAVGAHDPIVFNPEITSPKACAAWPKGSLQVVKWGRCKSSILTCGYLTYSLTYRYHWYSNPARKQYWGSSPGIPGESLG